MATIKSYTDIEQGRKLAEILPLESADGFWEYHHRFYSEGDDWEGYEDYPRAEPYLEYTRNYNEWKEDKSDVPCWSLAALLGVLPDYTLQTNTDGTVFVVCDSKKPMVSDAYDNPIDACYEMIIKLHNLNML